MCGSFDVAHWGQTLREGRASFQFAARRLRVLALLVLRFGTAIDLHFHQNGLARHASLDSPDVSSANLSPSSVAQRTSKGAAQSHDASFRSIPQYGHSPAQSSRHSGARGRSSNIASWTMGAKSTKSFSIMYASSSP